MRNLVEKKEPGDRETAMVWGKDYNCNAVRKRNIDRKDAL